jgi:apolipoprotein N-acyltransferase
MTVMVEDAPASDGRLARLRRLWPVLAAVAAGLLLLVAFPPFDLWWLAPFGVALLAVATYRRGFWAGAGLGAVAGLSLLIPLLNWAGGFVGAVWLFLPFGESLYFALLGALSALVTPALIRLAVELAGCHRGTVGAPGGTARSHTVRRLPVGPARIQPGRLGPCSGSRRLVARHWSTFGVAFVGGLIALAVLVLLAAPRPYQWTAVRPAAVALAIALVAAVAPATFPRIGTPSGTAVRVAVVQGNVPRLGLEFNAQRRAVLDNHVNATLDLARRVKAGQAPQPDLVVWPENSSDIDPITNADARGLITQAAQAVNAPILVGGLGEGPGPMDNPQHRQSSGIQTSARSRAT